jgi:iron complex outermembrane receptor protein
MPSPTQVGVTLVELSRLRLSRLFFTLLILSQVVSTRAQTVRPEPSVTALKELSIEELMELEVTSVSKRPERLAEAPSAIQVVTGEDIRRSGASSIPEALRLAGNLQVAQKDAHNWGISARGFNTDSANKLLVLMDGRAVYTPLFSGVFWDRQDYVLEDIERIEVISGPGGTLWGANAVNGVINITTKSAKDTQGSYLEAGGGTELRGFASLRHGGALAPHVHYRVYAKHTESDPAALADGSDAHDGWRMSQGGFRIDADPSDQNTFTLQGDLYQNRQDLTTGGSSEVNGGNVLGRWTRVFSADSDMSLQVYFDRTHLSLPVPAMVFAPAGSLHDDLDTYDVDFQHRFQPAARHRLVWGLGYRFTHDVVTNAPALAFFPAELDQQLFSGFVQDEISLRKDLTLTLGTRLEHNDYTGFETKPGGRLQWNVTDRQMLWGAVSHAVRAPSRVDRDISLPAPGYLLVILEGGSRFESENLTAYELGWRAQLGHTGVVSVSTFLHEYDDLRSTSMGPPDPVFGLPFPFFYENNLEGRTYGVEISTSWQVTDRWMLRASYNRLEEDLRIKPGRTDFNNALNETADPRHQAALRSSVDLPGNLEFDAGLRWVDRLRVNNAGVPVRVSDYAELDVRLGWRPRPGIELSLVGRNLLHDRHREYTRSNAPDVLVQRSVHGKLAWRF